MNNFAQTLGLEGSACLDYADQITQLFVLWIVFLVASLIFAILFLLLKKTKIGFLFSLYFVALLFIRSQNSADECGHGGLFAGKGSTGLMFLAGAIIITLVFGIISYWKSRKNAR